MAENPLEDGEGRIGEVIEILDRWRAWLPHEISVAALLSRCPIAYKWKAPFRCLVVREALLRRMLALGDGVVLLTNQNCHVGARVLLRSAVEAMALLEYTVQRMEALVKGHIEWARFDELTMKLIVGSRDFGDVEPIQILNAVRDAAKVYAGLKDIHDRLSETVHPNYDGVVGSFVKLDREEHVAYLGDFTGERYASLLVPYAGYTFAAFQYSYNTRWLAAIEPLEQWLRDNDERLEKLRSDMD
ncbi:MAG: hypothetical protein WA777_07820 [Rhodanobacter sp.]